MSQEQTPKKAKPPEVQPRHFKHQPLQDRFSARYLILQPASTTTEPLVCTLQSAQLGKFPPFEAISYVWGTLIKNQLMICNDKDILITANLSAALIQVRFKNKPRTLWVDSICINQADPEELVYQVSLMGEIYKKSTCTLICLGPSYHGHASIVEGLLTDVDERMQSVFGRANFDWSVNSFPFPDKDDPLLSHSGWTSFGILLSQPWFRRGWVVQEAALGPDAVVRWGDTNIDWLKLMRTYIWCIRRALKLPSFERLWLSKLHLESFHSRQNCEAITLQGTVESLSLLEILDSARWLDVTDPRDRIYAFLSVLELNTNKMHLFSVQPNYTETFIRVYRDFAVKYLRTFEDLDILHFVHNNTSTLECKFASWIPRWNLRLYSSYTGTLNNYSRTSRRILSRLSPSSITVSVNKTTLGLRIIILDTVVFAGEAFIKNSTKPGDVVSLWEYISSRSTSMPYYCSALRAFVEIFRCGVYRGLLKQWKTLESAYIRMLQRETFQGAAAYNDAESFHEMRMEDVHNRCFIMSNRGYYGLAPKAVREGDLCCIIFGTRSPFILRRTDVTEHYKLVGSVLILSRDLDHNGYPGVLGSDKKYEDWTEWGLQEKEVFLC